MPDNYHFKRMGDNIVCDNGHGGYTIIANIVVSRPCEHLLRHAQLAEDVERLMDIFLADTSGIGLSICPRVDDDKERYVHDA